jgi:hypothetical protein
LRRAGRDFLRRAAIPLPPWFRFPVLLPLRGSRDPLKSILPPGREQSSRRANFVTGLGCMIGACVLCAL